MRWELKRAVEINVKSVSDSPCVKKCKLHKSMCVACTRTINEIMTWKDMSTMNRMETMKKIEGQTSTHNCPNCSQPTHCALEDGKSISACWCKEIPISKMESDIQTSCLCRKCLMEAK
jgi:predicted Fe-S protein YdhL (DUF1289 family)